MATVVWVRGPSSGRQGGTALIEADGTVHGWIGGACAEPTVLREARRVLNDGEARLMYLGPAEDLDGHTRDGVVAVPIACASEGALEVFMEPVLPRPHVVVIGRSPAVRTLTRLVVGLDWRATVVDDGGGAVDVPEEATVIASLAELGGAGIDGSTAVVVATQGHYDEPALEAALATDAPYIGHVASRNRSESVLGYLRDRGHTDEELRRIHTPAGLDLGHIEHREIAVAVLAELVAIRASGGIAGPVATASRSEAGDETEAASAASELATAIDPICGMTVDTATARFTSEHNGTTVYFCCPACRKTHDDALV
jgi:xanthine dehydrogenase accessory factor